jgi:glycosyltransferase involved in cell wall biosynthesis
MLMDRLESFNEAFSNDDASGLKPRKPKRERIIFVLGSVLPFPGAGWVRVSNFARYFVKKGHEVNIIGEFSTKTLSKAKLHTADTNLSVFNICPTIYIARARTLSVIINALLPIIVFTPLFTILRPKVVIISVPTGEPVVGAFLAAKLCRAKVVLDYRDEWEALAIGRSVSKLQKKIYQLFGKLMDIFYIGSNLVVTVTSNFVRALNSRGIESALLPNGADTTVFKPHNKIELRMKSGLGKNDFVVAYSGTIGAYYRLDVVLKAIKKLVDNGLGNIKIVIAGGEKSEAQKMLSLALQLGIATHVEYKGLMYDTVRLSHLIAQADLGLIPYNNNSLWKNTIPAKFFEYCACGIPVIATAYEDSLLAEFIREYRIGITSPPMNEEKLAEAIHWMYQNRIFREAAGKRARLVIEEKFDRSKIANDFLNLLKTVD